MTETGPEPTNADLLAFMQTAFAHLTTEVSGVKADIAALKADVASVKGDVASVKGDTREIHRYVGEMQDRLHRHLADPGAHGHVA